MRYLLKIMLLAFLSSFLFCVTFIKVCGQSPFEKKLLDEVNFFRENPAGYVQKNLWFGARVAAPGNILSKIPASPRLIWSDSLFREAKKAGSSNFRNDGAFTKGFCGSAGFGSNDSNPDSLLRKFVVENFKTFLSPDYTHFGVYCYEETYYGTKYQAFFAYMGIRCGENRRKFTFPAKTANPTTVNTARINTAANEKYLSELEKEMIQEINFARVYPAVYADIISNSLVALGELSFDDWLAGQEIVEELKKMPPMNALLPDARLYQCAKNHGLDEAKRGYSGHTGSDGSSCFDRIKKALGSAYVEGSENLVGNSSPREAVISLLIDGGIASRGHRYNIINPNWTHVGCYYVGKVGVFPSCYVQNFAKIKP